jgi:hypothetical protein
VGIELNVAQDVLYLWLGAPGTRAARTVVLAPGVFADFDRADKLVGVEVLDAADVLGGKVQLEIALPGAGSAAD